MKLATVAVQLMFLVQGQVQTTTSAGTKGGVTPMAGGTGCLLGDTMSCTLTGCTTGIKTCTNHGTWGACVCQPVDCPSTTCRTGTAVFANGGWSCSYSNATLNTDCSDGDVCNGAERCDGAGTCRPGAPPSLDDGNPATLDFCGPGGVKHVQIASSGTAKEAFSTPASGPDPRSRALPVAPNVGGPVVDESRGTLSYRYSFELPSARGRYQPHLDLTYSSSTTYNDSVGAGWSLTSFYIETDTSRPPVSLGDNVPVRYWLVADGTRMRLLGTPNTNSYRTEVQGAFVSITSSPASWTATDASGTTFTFARRSPNVQSASMSGRWYLSDVVDVDLNTTHFTYQDESGASAFLTAIDFNYFSGNQTGTTVELSWSPDYLARIQRAADTVAYRTNILRTVRIKGASTDGKPTLLRHELTYTHQQQADTLLLSQVVVYAGDGLVSLPPTSFEYQLGTSTYELSPGIALSLEEYLMASQSNEQWLDLDGDGLPDRVAWPNWRRNTTSPLGAAVPIFATNALIPGAVSLSQTPGAPALSPAPAFVGNPLQAAFMDFDGDGILDLVTVGPDGASPRCDYQVWLGQGTGPSYSLSATKICIDALVIRERVAPTHFGIRYASTTAEAFSLMDVNGDGIPDLVKPDSTNAAVLDAWLGFPIRDSSGTLTGFSFTVYKPMVVPKPIDVVAGLDLNGDGLGGDYAASGDLTSWSTVVFGEGGRFTSTAYPWTVTSWAGGLAPVAAPVLASATLPVSRNQFTCPPPPSTPAGSVLYGVYFDDPRKSVGLTDLNGDGRPDFLVRPRPSDSICNSALPCPPAMDNFVLGGASCYDPAVACPLVVYWNTGAGFERGGTVGCAGGGACPVELFPSVAFASVPDSINTGVQCRYGWNGTNDPNAYIELSPQAGQTIFTAWSADFVDLNGDGIVDYTTNERGTWTYFRGNNVAPLLSKVTTAAGASYTVGYDRGSTFGAGPLDGARDVVKQVWLSGAGIPTATTNYLYRNPIHGPNPANFNRVEPRGFSESWSWLGEQGAGDKVAKHVTWVTSLSVLAGSPSKLEWGTFPAADPSSSFSPFTRTDIDYLVKSLDAGTCTSPAVALTPASFPVAPITTLVRNLDILDATSFGGQRTIACADVDAVGNVLKTSISSNGTWNGSAFTGTTDLVETAVFDLAATCKTCPTTQELKTAAGARLTASQYLYDSPTGFWNLPVASAGTGHLNYVKRWVSGARWDVDSATAYNTDGTVQSRVTDPYPGSHAVSTTESYTYDTQKLRVTETKLADGIQTIYSSATYDTRGLLATQSGPYLAGGLATAPTQAFARDAFGRVVAVGRSVSADATTGVETVTGAMAATEYVDTSPPVVKSYTFLAPTTFTMGAIPATPDVKQAVTFKDRLGRTTEVRERLGVAGTGSAASQVIQPLTGYRVVLLLQYDAAGRVVGSLEPTMTVLSDVTPSQFSVVAQTNTLRGAMTIYDAAGRVTCSKAGIYSALLVDTACAWSNTSDLNYRTGTSFSYDALGGLPRVTVKSPGSFGGTPATMNSVTTFRADGKVQDVSDPAGNTVTTSYDPLGRATAVTRKTSGLSAIATSTRTLDALGRVTDEWDDNWSPGLSPSRVFTYDQVGRAYSIELAPQMVSGSPYRTRVNYEFKSMGRPTRISVTEPSSTARWLASFTYDLPYNSNGALYTNTAGRLASVLGPNTTIALGYDQNGQAIRRDQWLAGLTGAFSLTGAISDDGRMLAASFFSGYSQTVNYFGRYDSAGRPVRVDAGGASAGAAPVVNLWEVKNAAATSNDGYDVLGRVGRLQSNGGTVDTYRNFDTFTGALTSQAATSVYGTKAYGIDSILYVGTKLRSFNDTTVAGTVTSYGYTYDEAGRLATAMANRMGPAAISQGYGQSYTSKDSAWSTPGASMENLEVMNDVSGSTDYAYQGDRATSLTTKVGGTVTAASSVSYDYAGRATSRTSSGIELDGFVHDALDRLTTIRRNGVAPELLEYAPTGELAFRKLGTQGTWYVGAVGTVTGTVAAGCLGIDTIAIPLASRCTPVAGTVKVAAHVQVAGGRVASIRAAAGSGVDAVREVLYYHRDMQGSVVATSYRSGGQNGFMGARYRYTPYGQLDRTENVTTLSDSELGYTGGLRLGYAAGAAQQGNLVLLGARVYHAELKRWLVPDTVDGRRYTYAGGDPVNFVDPSGRMAISGGGGVGGGGGGGSSGATEGSTGGQPFAKLNSNPNLPLCSERGLGPADRCYYIDEFGTRVEGTRADFDGYLRTHVQMDEQVVRSTAQGGDGWRGHLMDPIAIREWHIGNPIPGVGGPMDPFEVPLCFARGGYHYLEWPHKWTGRTHAFWYVQDSSGSRYILSGGPDGKWLGAWSSTNLTSGSDRASDPTFFDSGLSNGVCGGVDAMVSAVTEFPKSTFTYSPGGGPNSNTVAFWLGSIGGFESRMTAPPNTQAWWRGGLP